VAYPANVDPGGMPYALGAFGLAIVILGSFAIALLIPGWRRRRRLALLRDVAALVQLVGEPSDDQIRDAGLDVGAARGLIDVVIADTNHIERTSDLIPTAGDGA
jgi:hypothetical protein